MVAIERRKSRAPPLTYDVWPHLLAEKERKEGKDIRIIVP